MGAPLATRPSRRVEIRLAESLISRLVLRCGGRRRRGEGTWLGRARGRGRDRAGLIGLGIAGDRGGRILRSRQRGRRSRPVGGDGWMRDRGRDLHVAGRDRRSGRGVGESSEIEFEEEVFEGGAGATIVLGSALPPITTTLRIDSRQCGTPLGNGPCVGVDGPGTEAALRVEGAAGVEIEGLAVTGAAVGIEVSGAESFKASRDWFGVTLARAWPTATAPGSSSAPAPTAVGSAPKAGRRERLRRQYRRRPRDPRRRRGERAEQLLRRAAGRVDAGAERRRGHRGGLDPRRRSLRHRDRDEPEAGGAGDSGDATAAAT